MFFHLQLLKKKKKLLQFNFIYFLKKNNHITVLNKY